MPVERPAPPTVPQTIRYALDAVVASGAHLRVLSSAVVVFGVAVIGLPLGAVLLYAAHISAAAEQGSALSQANQETFALLAIPALVAGVVAFASFFIVLVQVPLWIVATVGGELAGQPVTLREALRRSRQVFWRGLGALVLIGIATGIPAGLVESSIDAVLGPTSLALGLDVLAGAVFAAPWVYVLPGIVLGGVGVVEALRRSWRLARYRGRLALTIALLAVVGQVIVIGAVEAAAGLVFAVGYFAEPRVTLPQTVGPLLAAGLYLGGSVLIASIVFAVQVVQFAPQASGFYALTRYAEGLEAARAGGQGPLFPRRALVFYGAGIVSALLIVADLLPRGTP